MQQQVLKCAYEACRLTVPSSQSGEVIEKLFEFQLPDGACIHSITPIKGSNIIGAPHQFLMLVERANTFIVDSPERTQ